MSIDRMKRVNELLHREISASLYHVLDPDEVDLSAITVTHVITTKDLRRANVLVSVRHPDKTGKTVMTLLRAHRKEIQAYFHGKVVLKYTPRLSFELDTSLQQGDRLLNLLSEIDIPEAMNDERENEERE